MERVGHLAYHLKLLSHWNIHDMINITFLEPAPTGSNPFNHVPVPLEAVHDKHYPNNDDQYDVEHILTKCTRHIRHTQRLFTEYLIHWKGFNKSHDEWLRVEDMEGAQKMVDEFKVTEQNE